MPEIRIPNCPRCATQLVLHPEKNFWVCPNWRPQHQGCEGAIYWPKEEQERSKPNILFSVKVESKSYPGFMHQVRVYESGDIYCGCMASDMGKFCQHKQDVVKIGLEVLRKIKKQ